MQLVRATTELKTAGRKVCAAIGFFDGVHLGHQQIIRQTIADARQSGALSVAITFDRHPNTVVAPHKVPPLVYTLPHKLRTIEQLGVDAILLLTFDRALSERTGEDFVRGLAHDFQRLSSVCVGGNFNFGHRRSGNVALLETLGRELNFHVHGHASVSLAGRIVSSTRIREAIQAGQLDLAGQMLGRPYSVRSIVMKGDQLGAKIGFPTANLDIAGLCLPPAGVYAARAEVNGRSLPGVLNLGRRPTLGLAEPPLRLEAHLFDFAEDLYDQEIEVVFGPHLRPEQRFPSLDALKEQIAWDVQQARQWCD